MSAMLTSETDALSATFAALSDPTRRAMLARLSQGEASVNVLAAPFKMSLPAISKHIKVLEKAGLLTKTINAQQRPCKIDDTQIKLAVDWITQNTIKNIAPKAINTPARAQNTPKNRVKTDVPPKPPKPPKTSKPLKTSVKPLENTHDNIESKEPHELQQQIGFDF